MHHLEIHVRQALERAGLYPEQSLLLACSGGKDSMVLLNVLLSLGYKPSVAHVNFCLRGEDSDADAQHVLHYCAEKNLEFYYQEFDTEAEADSHKESIQMAARRLRYQWLFGLMEEKGFVRVLTAHHERDQAETLLLNLMRGSGPKGLQGMLEDDGRLLRPMLRESYDEVSNYARQEGIRFREDRSNAEIKYRRNFIRHTLLAPWEERFPGTVHQMNRSAEIMAEVNGFLKQQMDTICLGYVSQKGLQMQIEYSLRQEPFARLLMRHLLTPFGLQDQVPFILDGESRPGAMFSSETHRLLADRAFWILEAKDLAARREENSLVSLKTLFNGKNEAEWNGFQFSWTEVQDKNYGNDAIRLNPGQLDGLYFRTWREGDKMHPFGMKGKKKLSDLLIDAGINRLDKEKIPVLCNEKGEILWLVGVRSSELLRLPENAVYIVLRAE
ncbi:MAG: tRNA lysidine(34) synthetase TilS [Bacteroidetes bacterium]|nr:tRNA lysidine(34) synthetase TilS [Bacteroidota bacterium]